MDDTLNPLQVGAAIVTKGVMLGVMLAIAWPVKQGIDKVCSMGYNKAKDAMRKKQTLMVDSNLIGGAYAAGDRNHKVSGNRKDMSGTRHKTKRRVRVS